MFNTCWTKYSPYYGGAAGCSHSATGGTIQETLGRVPVVMSLWKSAG